MTSWNFQPCEQTILTVQKTNQRTFYQLLSRVLLYKETVIFPILYPVLYPVLKKGRPFYTRSVCKDHFGQVHTEVLWKFKVYKIYNIICIITVYLVTNHVPPQEFTSREA